MNYHIRWMIRRDLPEALQCNTSWQEDDILRCLRHRNCIGMVVEDDQSKVCGFIIYELKKHIITLLEIAVNPLYHVGPIYFNLAQKLQGKIY